jgi:hypothetical protein
VALDFPVGTDFPANGNQIPDGEIYEGFYWDEVTGVWKRLCERDKIGDCLDDDAGETVCDKLDFIQREIVELEEEIDAIATSQDRGTWDWAFTVSNFLDPLPAGKFYMVDGNNGLAIATEYVNATKIIFSKTDAEGDNHSFTADLVDKVLMLFDRPDDDFLESIITAVDEPNGADYAIIDITHIQSLGGPTNQADADGRYKARLNIFDQPTGGNAGEYVLKQGDDMTGRLRMERDRESVTFDPPSDLGTAHIRFRNTKADNSTSSVALFQPGPSSVLVSTNEFMSKGDFTTHEYIKACWYYTHSSGDTRRTNKQPQIYFHGSQTNSSNTVQYGALQFGTSERFRWRSSGGMLVYGTPSDSNRNTKLTWNTNRVVINKPVGDSSNHEGFIIKGTTNKDGYAATTNSSKLLYNQSLLNVYHNNGGNDAINYMGKIAADSNNIVTSKWVKDNYGGTFVKRGGTQSVTIQYSNGNFLISQA